MLGAGGGRKKKEKKKEKRKRKKKKKEKKKKGKKKKAELYAVGCRADVTVTAMRPMSDLVISEGMILTVMRRL